MFLFGNRKHSDNKCSSDAVTKSGRAISARKRPSSQMDNVNSECPSAVGACDGMSMSNGCHKCGTLFPVPQAKYCCECGTKRIVE